MDALDFLTHCCIRIFCLTEKSRDKKSPQAAIRIVLMESCLHLPNCSALISHVFESIKNYRRVRRVLFKISTKSRKTAYTKDNDSKLPWQSIGYESTGIWRCSY